MGSLSHSPSLSAESGVLDRLRESEQVKRRESEKEGEDVGCVLLLFSESNGIPLIFHFHFSLTEVVYFHCLRFVVCFCKLCTINLLNNKSLLSKTNLNRVVAQWTFHSSSHNDIRFPA